MFSALLPLAASLEAGMCFADHTRNSLVAAAHRSRSAPFWLSVRPSIIASSKAIVSAASLHITPPIEILEPSTMHRLGAVGMSTCVSYLSVCHYLLQQTWVN